jgi:hypothetical protein
VHSAGIYFPDKIRVNIEKLPTSWIHFYTEILINGEIRPTGIYFPDKIRDFEGKLKALNAKESSATRKKMYRKK